MKLVLSRVKTVLVQRNVHKDNVLLTMTSEVHLVTRCINLK